MKTILFTGATGFIGSHLVKAVLKLKKYKIKIFIRPESDLSRLSKIMDKIEVFKGNFFNDKDINKSLNGVDIFIHLASVLGRGKRSDYSNFNVKVSERFFYYSVKHKVEKVIFLSSIEVMGGTSVSHEYVETNKPTPISSYGKSKYEVEKIAKRYIDKYNLNITILRSPAVYGPDDNFDRGFIKVIDLIAKRKFILFSDMQNYMAIIYVENLVDIIIKCMIKKKSNRELYFVGDNEILKAEDIYNLIIKLSQAKKSLFKLPLSFIKFFEGFFELTGKVFHFLPFYPENIVHNFTSNYACSFDKVKADLNWIPPYSFYEGMKKTIKWYKQIKS